MNNNNKQYTIAIRLSEKEKEILVSCLDVLGVKTSEFIRGLIRDKYGKMFPYHRLNKGFLVGSLEEDEKPKQTPTPREICEANGGRVEVLNGIEICRLAHFNKMAQKESSTYFPLNKVKEYFEDE